MITQTVFIVSDVEFEDFLNDIYDKKMLVYDALSKSRFREIKQSGRFDDLKMSCGYISKKQGYMDCRDYLQERMTFWDGF